MHVPELLAPAGNMEKLEVAIAFGADAVYLGDESFGLRAGAAFPREQLPAAVALAHDHGVKVYVTVNIFARNHDLQKLPAYLRKLQRLGVDGIIVSDPGVLETVQEYAPALPVHLSTQANTTNWKSALFWKKQGVQRIILARELSLAEIKEIREKVNVELEIFVHGAMCISYSGRCLLSSYLTGRDANQGDCAQACRWRYTLVEEKRPGVYFPIEEDARGTFILSSRDLCLLHHLPRLFEAGINSFKIEGRARSIHYVATITRVYRLAIDAYLTDPANYKLRPEWADEIGKVSNRDYIAGFLDGPPAENGFPAVEGIYRRPYKFVGVVKGYSEEKRAVVVEQRNVFSRGDVLEVMPPRDEVFTYRVREMHDEAGMPLERAPHPRQILYLPSMPQLPPYTMLRRPEN